MRHNRKNCLKSIYFILCCCCMLAKYGTGVLPSTSAQVRGEGTRVNDRVVYSFIYSDYTFHQSNMYCCCVLE
jgi:hypothetical protein